MISRILEPRHILGLLLIVVAFSVLIRADQSLPETRFAALNTSSDLVPIIPDVPRDAIPPLNFPSYDDVTAGDRAIGSSEFVFGIELNGDARAYPLKIMNWHGIVNDVVGGVPVAVTYGTLTRSGLLFDRRLEGEELLFGNTGALYESAMVMYDRESGSFWNHIDGRSILGQYEGENLELLPSTILTWGEWKERHPDTTILSRNTGFRRNYGSKVFDSYYELNSDPGFEVSSIDERLAIKEPVVGVSINGENKAYVPSLYPDKTIKDNVGGRKIEVDVNDEGSAAEVFLIEGNRRTLAPQTNALWFSWAVNYPRTEIYRD